MAGDHFQHSSSSATAVAAPEEAVHNGDQAEEAASIQGDGDQLPTPVESGQPNWSSWSNLWQAPAILLSLVLIAWGLYLGAKPPQPDDFDGALTQIEQMNARGEHDMAAAQLKNVIEPNLALATELQKARFHASLADYLYASLPTPEVDVATLHHRITEHFAKAVELGLALSPGRTERWAESLLSAGETEAARKRLAELDVFATDTANAPDEIFEAQAARNRVFRSLVEHLLTRTESQYEHVMTMLAEYRLAPQISTADEMWAIGRQTELRLLQPSSDSSRQAIDLLLVEMRRLDNRDLTNDAPELGELYMLLGRGYYEMGDYTRAHTHLDRAQQLFSGSEPARGSTLVLLGHIASATGDPDTAIDHYKVVVRDFIATSSYLPGLLGRAEIHSVLGSHEESLADYRMLCEQIVKPTALGELSKEAVTASLCDRYDAALALGKLERAIDYVILAENLFEAEHVPADVLLRLASVNRQIADSLIAAAQDAQTFPSEGATRLQLDPAIRRQANAHYERAGHYYLRHASASKSTPKAVEEASASSWLAADCFDLCGRQDLAIENFARYLDMHPIEDLRRPSTYFRLAQAQQAVLDFEAASDMYQRIIAEHPRSVEASQSHVPLARCYVAMNRVSQGRQQLQQVLSGSGLINPDASDYREALLELARIEYEERSHTASIEALNEFLQRYPTDTRAFEVRFLLADSYRANALAIAQRLRDDPATSASETGRLNTISAEQLQMAQQLFAQVRSSQPTDSLPMGDHVQERIRQSLLYEADCSYELGEFERAISLYDHAARQYSAHQSSMYALIQVVNSYNALSDGERAAAAHHRALVRLKQLPDEAFASAESLMNRSAWERWLEHNPVGIKTTSASPSGDLR